MSSHSSSIFSRWAIFIVFITLSCSPQKNHWNAFDIAVSTRDKTVLLDFAKNGTDDEKEQAWRALISSGIQVDTLLNFVFNSPNEAVFRTLMIRELNPAQLSRLVKHYEKVPHAYQESYINLLGTQTDLNINALLIREWLKHKDEELEFALAFAISRQSLQLGFPDSLLDKWTEKATQNLNEERHRAYLYGAYRARHSIIKAPNEEKLLKYMQDHWEKMSDLSRQYFIQVIAKQNNSELLKWVPQIPMESMAVQVQLEWVKAFASYMISPMHNTVFLHLLTSKEDIVLLNALEKVSAAFVWNNQVKDRVTELSHSNDNSYSAVSLAAKVFLVKAFNLNSGWNETSFAQVVRFEPYILDKAIEMNRLVFSPNEEVKLIEKYYSQTAIAGRQALISRHKDLCKQSGVAVNKEFIKSLLVQKDRSVLIELSELIDVPQVRMLFSENSILFLLKQLDVDADIEVFQSYFPILIKSESSMVKHYLDSLAAIPNQPLGSSLKRAGYKGSVVQSKTTLAVPNRKRLAKLGNRPKWIIETNKGEIIVELDTKRTPTTVWLIDSLSNAGLFNEVAFHRIVPNFVAQGGDFERGDGYGGSNTIIPTESSDLEFERGAVGMASAGTDTESAQYFFMHQWQPHLNYRYTRFGKVLDGLEVVDRLIRGDRVIKASVIAD